jgi:microcystin-dependent protein
MARVLVKDTATQLSADIGTVDTKVGIVTIPGEVKAYAGASAPTGFLFCHGQAVSRTTYSALYAILGNSHGSGDGLTTFNLPDYRGSFLRGLVNVNTVTGTGTASGSSSATFTAHGFNRTGFKVRLSSGTLTGLAAGVDYYAIVVDANTLRFATTKANALAGTYVVISGANSAVLVQYEDPDYSSREKLAPGGNATGLGALQNDAMRNISGPTGVHATGAALSNVAGNPFYFGGTYTSMFAGVTGNNQSTGWIFDASRQVPTGSDNRPKNVLINYIIKY